MITSFRQESKTRKTKRRYTVNAELATAVMITTMIRRLL
jgi:ribosomal protein L32